MTEDELRELADIEELAGKLGKNKPIKRIKRMWDININDLVSVQPMKGTFISWIVRYMHKDDWIAPAGLDRTKKIK